MSEALIYIAIFSLVMFFMHRGHGGRAGHGCHMQHEQASGHSKGTDAPASQIHLEHSHHHRS